MLHEFKGVSQPRETPGYRRWFSDADMELVLWYSPSGAIRGFQLCYDRNGRERAFTWRADGGLAHAAVDEGDDSPLRNDAPILVPAGVPSADLALAQFKERARGLDPEIVDLVSRQLETFRRPR